MAYEIGTYSQTGTVVGINPSTSMSNGVWRFENGAGKPDEVHVYDFADRGATTDNEILRSQSITGGTGLFSFASGEVTEIAADDEWNNVEICVK